MIRRLVLIVFLAYVAASSSHAQMYDAPGYEKHKLRKGERLVVAEIGKDRVVLLNEDDVADDLGKGDSKEIFLDFLKSKIPIGVARTTPYLKPVRFAEPLSRDSFEQVVVNFVPKDTILLTLPPEGKVVRFDTLEADYVLFIGRLWTVRFDAGNGGYMYDLVSGKFGLAPPTSESSELRIFVNYGIWDNRAGKLMSYGKMFCYKAFWPAMTKNTWRYATEAIGDAIVQYGFFHKK